MPSYDRHRLLFEQACRGQGMESGGINMLDPDSVALLEVGALFV